MTRKSKITKKELAAALRESVAAINKPGPLRVIVDVGDTRYYVQRAIELLTLVLESPTPQQQAAYLEDAIFLLGVVKCYTNNDMCSEEEKWPMALAAERKAVSDQEATRECRSSSSPFPNIPCSED